jgi:probable HAF family extracellular repeat protein
MFRPSRRFLALLFWSLLMSAASLSASAAPLYTAFSFDPFYATPPNNKGQVVSLYAHQYPALFDGLGPNAGNSGVELVQQSQGLIGGDRDVQAVNDAGQVTGWTGAYHAMLVTGGIARDLGTLGGSYSQGMAINSQGQVAGFSSVADGTSRAFLYSTGAMQDLGTLPGGREGLGFAINDRGQVAGYSEIGSGSASLPPGFKMPNTFDPGLIFGPGMIAHAVIFDHGKVTDLGTLGGSDSVALGINSSGTVVGSSQTASGVVHAFVYQAGHLIDLGTLTNISPPPSANGLSSSHANAVNDLGQIVGTSNGHAFLFDQGRMLDLNTLMPIPHVTLIGALSINNLGQIMALGEPDPAYYKGFVNGEYLLTPTSLGEAEYGVPEPSTTAFVGLVVAILAARRARRRLHRS